MTPSEREEQDLDQASRWFLAAREGRMDAAEAEALERWLIQHPDHRQAYRTVAEGWDAVGILASDPALIAMRRKALAQVGFASGRGAGRWWRAGIAAAFLIAVGAALGYGLIFAPQPYATYRTAAGERRTITLADQSKVAMDEATRVEIRYARRARAVRLVSGQAEFRVAHDPGRPFTVTAAGHTVVATGTAFNVDLIASRLVVTLLEGRVLVADAGAWTSGMASAGREPPVELAPLDQLTVTPGQKLILRRRIDSSAAVAWKLGKLVFENEPLSQAVERMNRYGGRKISLLDPAIAATPVSGVFDAGDASAFVDAVSAQLKVRDVEGPDGSLRLYRRD